MSAEKTSGTEGSVSAKQIECDKDMKSCPTFRRIEVHAVFRLLLLRMRSAGNYYSDLKARPQVSVAIDYSVTDKMSVANRPTMFFGLHSSEIKKL